METVLLGVSRRVSWTVYGCHPFLNIAKDSSCKSDCRDMPIRRNVRRDSSSLKSRNVGDVFNNRVDVRNLSEVILGDFQWPY